ncbi:MAG TPA: ATP-binding protein [Ktedonobacterales bacterium]
MSSERIPADASPQHAGLQILKTLLDVTGAAAACYAELSAEDTSALRLATFWYPPESHPPEPPRWVKSAIERTLASGRSTLSAGRWAAALSQPRRVYQVVVARVTQDGDSARQRALALLLPADDVDAGVIARAEEAACALADALRTPVPGVQRSEPASALASGATGPEELRGQVSRILAHQLRAPLGAARYALEALRMRRGADWDDEDDHLSLTARLGIIEAQSILRAARRLRRTEGGSLDAQLTPLALEPAIARVCDLFPHARGRLTLDIPQGLPKVMADGVWLTQTLMNVVDNAVNHTQSAITVSARAQADDKGRIQVTVRSSGADFTLDEGVELALTETQDGAPNWRAKGLGLPVSRYLMAGMEGDIWIEREGEGVTVVVLALPAVAL